MYDSVRSVCSTTSGKVSLPILKNYFNLITLLSVSLICYVFLCLTENRSSLALTEPSEAKLSPRLEEMMKGRAPAVEGVFWIFFTDKGILEENERRQMLKGLRESLPGRTLERRRLRGSRTDIVDDLDLPVSSRYTEAILDTGAMHRATSRWLNAVSVRCEYGKLPVIAAMDFVDRIDLVRPTVKRKRGEMPVDNLPRPRPAHVDSTDYGHSFNQLNQLNIPAVHDLGYDGSGMLVCMLDTGFERSYHPAIAAQVVEDERDFINDDDDTSYDPAQDDYFQPFHGSITMCTVGGYEEGKYIAPAYNAHFILAKTEDTVDEQPIEEDWWVEGIEWADSLGADVASSSLGYYYWYTFEDLDGNTAVTTIAADIAASKGIVVVTAAGNEREENWGHIICPADGDSVIAVGAVDSLGNLASFSSPGPTYDGRIKPDLCARGVNTACAWPYDSDTYIQVGGTSLSTPLIAGSVALVLQAHQDWSPVTVLQALRETADNAYSPDNDYGWGVIDVLAAINWTTGVQAIHLEVDTDSDGTNRLSWRTGGCTPYGYTVHRTDTAEGMWENISGSAFLRDTSFVDGQPGLPEHGGMGDRYLAYRVIGVSRGGDTMAESNLVEILASRVNPIGAHPLGICSNPFNPRASIRYRIDDTAGEGSFGVSLDIYDIRGSRVRRLFEGTRFPGEYTILWDGRSDRGTGLPSGLYCCRLLVGGMSHTTRLLLLK